MNATITAAAAKTAATKLITFTKITAADAVHNAYAGMVRVTAKKSRNISQRDVRNLNDQIADTMRRNGYDIAPRPIGGFVHLRTDKSTDYVAGGKNGMCNSPKHKGEPQPWIAVTPSGRTAKYNHVCITCAH